MRICKRSAPHTHRRRLFAVTWLGGALVLSAATAAVFSQLERAGPAAPVATAQDLDPPGKLSRLSVAPTRRHLVDADGRPFFYLGDTAWALFQRLSREEADHYLSTRAAQGFNVVQAAALAEHGGLERPNAYGDLPLLNRDPATPNERYFRHVDYVVDKAEALGLYVGMLPTWGSHWHDGVFTPENAFIYGAWIAARYQHRPIIWILGGDRDVENRRHAATLDAMAEGIRSVVGSSQLIGFHPRLRRPSTVWAHRRPWLDFNMLQSSHFRKDLPNHSHIRETRALTPAKPVIDGEPRYEDHPIGWRPDTGRFDAYDVRQAAYWAVLGGAFGHTYGDHNVWQFYQPGAPGGPVTFAATDWRAAVLHPGATQMTHLKALFLSRPFLGLQPAQGLLANPQGRGAAYVASAQGADYAVIYLGLGQPAAIRLDRFPAARVRAWWFDPRSGSARPAGLFEGGRSQRFDPPGATGRGNDWVLVLDDAAKRYPPPGVNATGPG